MNPLEIILGGITLPLETGFIETTTSSAVDNMTLDGTTYTDFMTGTNKRTWEIDFMPIGLEVYQNLYYLYLSQFVDETYLSFECDAVDLNTIVKVAIGTGSYQANGCSVEGLVFNLTEQSAINQELIINYTTYGHPYDRTVYN